MEGGAEPDRGLEGLGVRLHRQAVDALVPDVVAREHGTARDPWALVGGGGRERADQG